MAAILPLAAYVAILLFCHRRCSGDGEGAGLRHSAIVAAILWGVFVAGVTELLSAVRLLTGGAVAAAWSGCLVVFAVMSWGRRSAPPATRQTAVSATDRRFAVAGLCAMGTILAVTAVVAFSAPPNTWDSMTYHMARVIHWIQQGGIGLYPTNIPRQLYLAPFAEYVAAHLQLLTGGDRWANFVQWSSGIGAVTAVSLIARELGAGVRGQVLAGLFAATLPMAVLQSTSTQNDLVESFWLASLGYLVLRSRRAGLKLTDAALFGASLGLALLTKGTGYILVSPFLALLIWIHLRAQGWRLGRTLLLAGAVCALLNLGFWTRNFDSVGFPLGPVGRHANRGFDPRLLASNVIRNTALHLVLPWSAWNSGVERTVIGMHQLLGLQANDPRSTHPASAFAIPSVGEVPAEAWTSTPWGIMRHEDHAGNPLHACLILITGAALCLGRGSSRAPRDALLYAVAVMTSFLLICFLLQWSEWNPRLQLPCFILWGPLVGIVGERGATGRFAGPAALILALLSLPWVLGNVTRPLLGNRSVLRVPRSSQYFASRPSLEEPFRQSARFIANRGWSRLGLICGGDDGEYAMWAVLTRYSAGPVQIEHMDVENYSSRFAGARDFLPEVVLCIARAPSGQLVTALGLREGWRSGPIRILTQDKIR